MSSLLRKTIPLPIFLLLAGIGATVGAQGRMTIQATATGTSTQLGKIYEVHIYIEQLSTPDDQQRLIDAFSRSRQDGLVDALHDMKAKGRVRFSSGGVGNEVKYIVELPSEEGRRFRLVTDRNIAFAEQHQGARSEGYSVGVIELILTPDGKGSGTLMPACKLTLDKKTEQIENEFYQNPWKLTNLIVSND